MLPFEIRTSPPQAACIIIEGGYANSGGGSSPPASADDAWAAAVANIPTAPPGLIRTGPIEFPFQYLSLNGVYPSNSLSGAPGRNGNPGSFYASAYAGTYRMGGISGTGYLRIWWNVITSITTSSSSGSTASTTTEALDTEITFQAIGGLIVPGNANSLYDWLPTDAPTVTYLTMESEGRAIAPLRPSLPASGGSASISLDIQLVKWSCIPGYVPPDAEFPNGFPA